MNRIGEMGEIFLKAKSDYVPRRTILHLCCSSACPESWGSSAPTQDQAQTLADMFVLALYREIILPGGTLDLLASSSKC